MLQKTCLFLALCSLLVLGLSTISFPVGAVGDGESLAAGRAPYRFNFPDRETEAAKSLPPRQRYFRGEKSGKMTLHCPRCPPRRL